MGIKDLYKLIPKELLLTYKFEELRGIKVAVDISIFLYKTVRSCGEGWMNSFIQLLCLLKKHNIKAVCIFDGPNPPIEKQREQKRRRSNLAQAIARLEECKIVKDALSNQYLNTDNTVISAEMKEKCKTLIIGKSKREDFTNYHSLVDIIESFDEIIRKLSNQTLAITDIHKNGAKTIVKLMNLHCVQADGEAEGVCASLLLAGQVDAIMTEDTDVLAYGCTLMLAFKDYKFSEQKMVGVYLPSVLEYLELNQKEFTDLCILLGCDYNKRIKAWPQDSKHRKKPICIGMKNALEFIQEFRSLDVIVNFIPEPGPLAYERCRELFIAPNLNGMEMVLDNLEPDYNQLEEFIVLNKISISVDHIRKCYEYRTVHYNEDEGFIKLNDGEVSSEGEEEVFA